MKFLFYIASLVCVSSVPISSVPERQINRSLIGLRTPSKWAFESNPFEGYMVVAQDRYCKVVHRISDSALNKPSPHDVANHQACKKKCSDDGSCNYYLWEEAGSKTCATFRRCGITTPFQDGHGGFIYKKLTDANFVTPNYYVTSLPIKSTKLPQEDDLLNPSYTIGSSSNPCGLDCTLAMPRTSIERNAIKSKVLAATIAGNQAWGGTYVWLGGHWNYTEDEWYWNDGTQISQFNWDNNEPGHDEGVAKDTVSNAKQPFLGLRRNNGKWHDFHGNDQGSNGKEQSKGQQGVCESVTKYEPVSGGVDKYCCGSNCNAAVILDTHCLPANSHCADEATTALWGNQKNCERSCSSDPNCKFYLWRHDQTADAPYTCATFKTCHSQTPFNDGHGGQIWKKK